MSEAQPAPPPVPVPDVTAIVVNWNGVRWLPRCLGSLLNQTGVVVEVILVDNASADDSLVLVREQFPSVRLIANQTNRGFAAANNQAMRCGQGRYMLLVNNDAWLEADAARRLVALADGQPNVGMVGARVLTDDGFWQPTYGPTLTLNGLLFSGIKPKQAAEMTDVHDIEYLTGVCMLVKRSLLAQVGLLDEGFFMYYEDMDWGVRARRAGWQIAYCPEATAHHVLRRVDQKARPANLEVEIRRSQVRYARKHLGLAATWIAAIRGLGYLGWSWLRSSLVRPPTAKPSGGARAWLQSVAGLTRELFGWSAQHVERL